MYILVSFEPLMILFTTIYDLQQRFFGGFRYHSFLLYIFIIFFYCQQEIKNTNARKQIELQFQESVNEAIWSSSDSAVTHAVACIALILKYYDK